MHKYIYRNKNNQFFNYYLENGSLIEHELYSQNTIPRTIAKDLNSNLSVTFSKAERPNLFFIDKSNSLCINKFNDNIWIQEVLHELDFKPEFFKVLEFQNSYALIYTIKTAESRVYDMYMMYINNNITSPLFLSKVYSQPNNHFVVEEIALNHYALLFKNIENKKIHLNYMEINNSRQSKPVVITSNELNIQDETFLFDEHAYCLYTKKRNYSQQLCLKVISNFNNIPTKEYLIFEGKNVDNANIYIANNKLNVHFLAGKNTMTKISDDLLNINFGKLTSEYENGQTLEKTKFLGYSLNDDNFRANNLYINNKSQITILNKYCNFGVNEIIPQKNIEKQNPSSISQYELRNKALLEENRNLKKQLRKHEN